MKRIACVILICFMLFGCATEQEIGMLKKADNKFLNDLERSITERMANLDSDNWEDLVNDELFILQGFKNEEFYDGNVKTQALKYIEGLELQKQSFNEEYRWAQQICWQEGLVLRLEALNELYSNYEFMKGNETFEREYIYDSESEKEHLEALVCIIEDITSQQGSLYNYWLDNTWYIQIENNTQYRYDITYEVEYIDANGVVCDKEYASAENVKANQKYTINIWFANPYLNYPSFYCRNFSIDKIYL